MRFFFDRNMPPRLARMVDVLELEHTVRSYYDDDRFGETTTDVEWIRVLSTDESTWAVVSGDRRILKNKSELAA
jgi:PIN like domain